MRVRVPTDRPTERASVSVCVCVRACICMRPPSSSSTASSAGNSSFTATAADDEIKDFPAYMKRFDKLNVEQVLNNDRVLASHLKCFLNEGPCVQQSRDLKSEWPKTILFSYINMINNIIPLL